VLDVFAIAFDGGADERAGVGIAADKLGGRREREASQIVEDENLTVAIGPRADANGGDGSSAVMAAATSRECLRARLRSSGIGESDGVGPEL